MAQLATKGKNSFTDVAGRIFAYTTEEGKEVARQRAIASSQSRLTNSGLRIENGRFVSVGTGKDFGTNFENAKTLSIQAGEIGETQVVREEKFEDLLGQFRGEIKEAGAERQEIAETRSARQFGTLSQQVRNVLLSQGEDPAKIGAVLAGGQEQQQRGLQDLLAGIGAETKSRLAETTQLEIGTGLGLEELGIKEQTLQQQMAQFFSSQALEREKFQTMLDLQPGFLEELLGDIGGGFGQAGSTVLIAKLLGLPLGV